MLQVRLARLGDYAEDCRNLDAKTFALRHGNAYFLHFGSIDKLQQPSGQRVTISSELPENADAIEEPPFNPQADFLVFPVGDIDPLHPGTIGRSEHSNIYIPDVSVSALHAIVLTSDAGEFYLLDAGSTNGTFVLGNPVPIIGLGKAVRLTPGQRVRFGSVNLNFLKASELHALIGQLLK